MGAVFLCLEKSMADDLLNRADLVGGKIDVKDLGECVHGNETGIVTPRLGDPYPTLPAAIKKIIETGGFEPFLTETQLLASTPTISPKAAKALDTGKIWYWGKDDGETEDSWHDTGLSELDQANAFTTDEVLKSKEQTINVFGKSLNGMSLYTGNNDLIPLHAGNNSILLGYSKSKQKVIGLGLQESDFYKAYANIANSRIYIGNGDLIPVQVGQNGGIALAWSKSKGKMVGVFDTDGAVFALSDLNQFLFYGQSLSRGFKGTPVLSTTQPQNNLALTGGSHPTGFTSLVPLFENDMESPCSGAANYAAYLSNKENGIDHQIVASTAGVNDALLSALRKGTSAYAAMLAHIQAVNDLKEGETHAQQAFGWLHGEANLSQNVGLVTYKPDLKDHFVDMQNDAMKITGQSHKPKIITYQLSTRIGLSDAVCKAQFELCKEKFSAIASPTYILPYDVDGVHLTNVGYKWLGAYFGRAYKQYVIDNRHPDYLEPLSAELVENKIVIKFNVPQGPLVFDTTVLAATQDHGFAVKSGGGLLTITNLEAKENTVEITLSSVPSIENLSVRYGLDYMAANKYIRDGKSGNLRDSTTDTVMISGSEKPLFHVCPHFELNIISGEI